MGVKSEKKRIIGLMGVSSGSPEFIENLFDQLHHNKLSEASKKIIKSTLAKKFSEFDILDTEPVKFLYKNLSVFTKNIFDEKYQDCVLEIQNNQKRVNMSNLLTEVRNSNNKNNKKKNNNKKRK